MVTIHSFIHSFIHSQSNPNSRLQDKSTPRRASNATVPRAVQWLRSQVKGHSPPVVVWSLLACSVALCLLRALRPADPHPQAGPAGSESKGRDVDVASGPVTPPDEGGKSESEGEEVYKVKPEEREDEHKDDTGDEELAEEQEEEEVEEVYKLKPEESEDNDDTGDEGLAEEEEEEGERADLPGGKDASGMRKRK